MFSICVFFRRGMTNCLFFSARVAGRFRPKAKTKFTKPACTTAASNFSEVVTISSTVSDTVPYATSVDAAGSSSEILGEHLCSTVPSFDDDRITKPSESAVADTPQPSAIVAVSNGREDSHCVFRKPASENVEIILSRLECLDDFLTQTTSGAVTASQKSPDKANAEKCGAPTHCAVESSAFIASEVTEAQTISDYCATQDPVSCTEAAMSIGHGEIQLETKEFEALDVVSEDPISTGRHAGKFQPKLRVKKGIGNSNILHPEIESTTFPQPAHFETGEMDESSLCAFPHGDVQYQIAPTLGDSIASNPSPNFQENEKSFAETTLSEEAVYGDAAHSEGVNGRGHKNGTGKASTESNRPQNRKHSAPAEEAEDGTSSRKSRKRLPTQQVDEPGNNTYQDTFNAENSSDYDHNEDKEHSTKQKKRAPRKSKIPVSENEKPVQKRKRSKKAPVEPTKEPTKKKFSHSTCRNRRCVKKSLIEVPEDEIDPQKLVLSDLIRLGEYRERLEIKEASKLETPASNQRDGVSTSSFSLNYASYMKKSRHIKWSEQDTERFYEGIELFGSDFGMVALLFPGLDRQEIRLKYKNEERNNRLRINEALGHQPKDNSKYDLMINELQKVAREKKKLSNADESSDMADQEEEVPTYDNIGEVTKPELDNVEDMETDDVFEVQHEEAPVGEVHSPMKSNQSDDGDGFGGWDDDF